VLCDPGAVREALTNWAAQRPPAHELQDAVGVADEVVTGVGDQILTGGGRGTEPDAHRQAYRGAQRRRRPVQPDLVVSGDAELTLSSATDLPVVGLTGPRLWMRGHLFREDRGFNAMILHSSCYSWTTAQASCQR
jgi:hypothetical protein